MKLVFATNNKHKLEEISHLLEGEAEIGSLAEIGCQEDIPEDHDTLEENALQKARYIKEHYGYDCFADDTGLEIEALDKRPGVYSARYAGPAKDSVENMKKVLREMEGISDRKACFRTVLALIHTRTKKRSLSGVNVRGKLHSSQWVRAVSDMTRFFNPKGSTSVLLKCLWTKKIKSAIGEELFSN